MAEKNIETTPGAKQGSADEKQINEQLERILNSDTFTKKYRLNSFLRYVVEQKLTGREKQIKAYSIGVDVFEREKDFDSSIDPIVRIQAGRLRRTLELYYALDGKNDEILITIPKGSYVPVFKLKSDEPSRKNDRYSSEQKQLNFTTRILILPFKDNSPDRSLGFYASTIAEDLSSGFTDFICFEVISHYSAIRIREKNLSIDKIREQHKVDYLINGSVNKYENKLVFKVSLIEASSKTQLWSNTFEESLATRNSFEILKSVSSKIIAFVGGNYGAINRELWKSSEQKEISNLQARKAIFLYNQVQLDVGLEKLYESEKELTKVLAENPDFALGWATMGEINIDQYHMIFENRDSSLEKAGEYIRKSILLDPCLQYGYYVLGYYHLLKRNIHELSSIFSKILYLNPNEAYYVGGAAFWLSLSGDFDKGLEYINKSTQLNPYYPTYFHHAFMLHHISKGNIDEANQEALRFNNPNFFWSHLDQAATYGLLGETIEAEKSLRKLHETNPDFVNHPLEYTSVFVPQENLLEQMMIGLKHAGLKMK